MSAPDQFIGDEMLPKVYIPASVVEGNAIGAGNLTALSELYGYDKRLVHAATLDEIEADDFWVMPVFLGMSHRLTRATARDFAYFDTLAQAEKQKVNDSHNGYVLLDMAVENLASKDAVFDQIHIGAEEAGLKVSKLVVVNCNALSAQTYAAYCDRLNIEERALIVPFNACLWRLIGHNRDESDLEKKALIEKVSADRSRLREKAFLSTNGRLRPHRVVTVLSLMQENLLDRGFVSFLGYGAKETADYTDVFAESLEEFPNFSGLHSQISVLNVKMPMTLDTGAISARKDKKVISSKLPWMAPDPDLYLDSYFSLVTETILRDRETIFLTPIVFKPIMSMHPFVLLGGCGALANLRELGFKTFSKVIDESYDDICDYEERTAAVLAEGQRLASLPQEELHDIYYRLYPEIQHNFEMFWDRLYPQFDTAVRKVLDVSRAKSQAL